MSSESRGFAGRSWRHHPVLSALYVAVGPGIAGLGITSFVDVHSAWGGGVLVDLWCAWFVLLVVLVRRDEPPTDR